jgi:hypothetical protein
VALLASALPAFATTTYYIAANGSDSNNGTSKATPWLHAPGMPNCSGTCASTTPVAGNHIIFRGGDTWHFGNSSLSPFVGGSCVGNTGTGNYVCWNWQWSGSSGNPIYIGVDQTWYSGSSWVRPVMNGDNPLWTGSGYPASCASNFAADTTSSADSSFVQINQSYVTFDNFEFVGLCYTGNPNIVTYLTEEGGDALNVITSNYYGHGWTRTSAAGESNYCVNSEGGGTAIDNNQYVGFVCDGSDSPHWPSGTSSGNCPSTSGVNGCATGGGIYGRASYVSQSVMRYLSDAVVAGEVCSWHDNLIEYIYNSPVIGAQHSNYLNNDNSNACTNVSIYNNVFRHGFANEAFYLTPGSSGNLYFFNNVMYDMMNGESGGSAFANPAGCAYLIGQSSGTANFYFYGNTMGDGSCQFSPGLADGGGTGNFSGNVSWENNQFIGYTTHSVSKSSCTSGALCPLNTTACTTGCTLSNSTDNGGELYQTEAAANAQGYTASNEYAPTTGGATLGTGANLAGSCSTFSSDSALCSGTSDGALEQAGSGGEVAIYPAIAVVARPASGAWDVGAYQFSNSGNWYVSASGSDSNSCTAVGSPCLTLAHAESLSSAADTINIAAGTYRLSTSLSNAAGAIVAKANQTFTGPACTPTSAACSAILSGSVQFTSGQILGPDSFGNYYVTGQTQHGLVGTGTCDSGWSGCNYPEDVFVNGVPYQHLGISSEATLSAGTWWFDYATTTIYLPSTLTPTFVGANTVETSVLETAFLTTASGVTIENLSFEEFAAPLDSGAVDPAYGSTPSTSSSLNWTVQNSYFTLNHGVGARIAFGMQIVDNVFTVNGNLGAGGGTPAGTGITPSGLVMQGNTVTYNNYAHFNPGFQGGGLKFGNTAYAVIRGNNVSYNLGQGVHFDDDSPYPLIDGNTVNYNVDPVSGTGQGIILEISTVAATFRNNIARYNGESASTGPNYQIGFADSGGPLGDSVGDQMYCNVMEADNSSVHMQQFSVFASNRGNNLVQPFMGQQVVSVGNYVHHNTVIWDAGSTVATGYEQNDATNQPNFFADNTPPNFNQYHAPTTTAAQFTYDNNNSGSNTNKTFANYQAAGADVNGTIDTINSSGFPTVAITSPIDQTSVGNPVTISASASDTSGIAKVEIYVDWTLTATLTSSPYTYSWSGTGGAHTVAAMAYSNAGVRSCNAVSLNEASGVGPPPAPANLTIVVN